MSRFWRVTCSFKDEWNSGLSNFCRTPFVRTFEMCRWV